MRIIDDATYTEIIKMLLEEPKVRLFQRLVLAPTAEPTAEPDKIETESEVK
jgi:hypothetical protein